MNKGQISHQLDQIVKVSPQTKKKFIQILETCKICNYLLVGHQLVNAKLALT